MIDEEYFFEEIITYAKFKSVELHEKGIDVNFILKNYSQLKKLCVENRDSLTELCYISMMEKHIGFEKCQIFADWMSIMVTEQKYSLEMLKTFQALQSVCEKIDDILYQMQEAVKRENAASGNYRRRERKIRRCAFKCRHMINILSRNRDEKERFISIIIDIIEEGKSSFNEL